MKKLIKMWKHLDLQKSLSNSICIAQSYLIFLDVHLEMYASCAYIFPFIFINKKENEF